MTAMRLPLPAVLVRPIRAGDRTLPPLGLILLAAIGACLLIVIAATRWGGLQDEHAYWAAAERLVAGAPLYDPTADVQTPYAYWYPPPLAQLLAPFTPWISDLGFSLAWTVLLIACLIALARGRVLVALALVVFIPVAVELWYRNAHLLLAALAVLALRRWPVLWVPAAALKLTPVIGVAYLAAAGRWRQAALVTAVGLGVIAISFAAAPGLWLDFLEVVVVRAPASTGAFIAVPFPLRFAVALALAIAGGRLGGRRGESLLILGLVVGNPTLWLVAFSMLTALVPIWWDGRPSTQPAADGAHVESAARGTV